jgi:ferric-dicitrate binding protein FerR (iron transport regulator)
MENTAIQDFVIAGLTGDSNTQQQQLLQEWLSASTDNRVLYKELKQIWDTAGNFPSVKFDREEGWEELSQDIHPASRNRWWLKAAAVLLPLLIFATYYFYHTNTANWNTYIASGAIKDSLLLPDGTSVYLKSGTVLSYRKREVRLENGEAFFKVVKDEQQFVIKAGNATIQVLGTSFNVRRTPACADVTVWDGKVSLAGKKGAVILTMGRMGIVDQYTGEVCKKEGNYEYRCGWANNDLAFNNQSLKIVLDELSACYHVQLKTTDTAILKRNVTIRFSAMPLADALSILSETMDIKVSRVTDSTYILTERK